MIYIACIFISIYAFGHQIHSDILKNVGEHSGWETYILSGLFAIVGALHIPLIFYVGKDALLIIVFTLFYIQDEVDVVDHGDVSQITVSHNLGNAKSRLMEGKHNNDASAIHPSRSELNKTNLRSALRKTTIIPNIDVSITKQMLSVAPINSALREGGVRAYESDLKAQDAHHEPSHKDLPFWVYLLCTFFVYGFDVSIACFVDDVSIVFGFVGALSISMLFFILPGLFYLRAVKLSDENGTAFRKFISFFYIFLGFCLMIGGIISVAVKIAEDGKKDIVEPEH